MIWDKDTPVILYGAAHVGTQVYKHWNGSINIVAFADRRADEIESYFGLPVYHPDSSGFTDEIKVISVIAVCVKNVFDHEIIAQNLINAGFTHIVYCPVDGSSLAYRSDDERNAITEIYSDLIEGKLTLPREVPSARGLFSRYFSDGTLISNENGTVNAYVHAMFCRSRLNNSSLLHDVPILSLFPYFELFDYFDGEPSAGKKYYIDFATVLARESGPFETTKGWVPNAIATRRMVYERMRVSNELAPDFFVSHAVTADWNASGCYFNLNGGKHRAAYMIHKKHMFIPLKLTKSDYEHFLNASALTRLAERLQNDVTLELPYPIWHPFFVNIPYSPDGNFFSLLREFTRWLSKNLYVDRRKIGYSGISVLDTTDVLFQFDRCLSVLGCAVTRELEVTAFDKCVDALYRTKTETSRGGQYDVLLSLGEPAEKWRDSADYGLFLLPRQHACAEWGLTEIGRYFINNREYICAAGKAK